MSELFITSPSGNMPMETTKFSTKKLVSEGNHNKVSEMVIDAISNLNDRKGSSLKAIKKYIGNKQEVDVENLAPFIRKCLKSAVAGGTLTQTKGSGCNGSFKLSAQVLKENVDVKKEKPSAGNSALRNEIHRDRVPEEVKSYINFCISTYNYRWNYDRLDSRIIQDVLSKMGYPNPQA